MRGLRTAVAFLTVLPGGSQEWEPARAVAWYPVVGVGLAAVVGCAVAGLYTAFPPLLAAALGVGCWAIVSGGLHLDGLADTADAAFAPVTRERRLAILADVHHGTFAVVSVVLILLVKVSALASMGRAEAVAAVVVAVVGGRGVLPMVSRGFGAARPDGMGAATRAGATSFALVAGAAVGAVAGAVAFGWMGIAVFGGTAVAALASGWWLSSRFGGLTGDTYGAIVEVAETVAIVAIAGLVTNGHASAFPFGVRL